MKLPQEMPFGTKLAQGLRDNQPTLRVCIYLDFCLSVPIYLFIYLFIYLLIYLFIYLFIYSL